ncbi:MAG: hypothetical protein ACE5HA_13170 [Anaerolineae bacterium]
MQEEIGEVWGRCGADSEWSPLKAVLFHRPGTELEELVDPGFEGADAAWIDPKTVLLATGLRTNAEGAAQVTSLLWELGVEVIPVGLSFGTMHLMGQLRFADRDLAIAWPGHVPFAAVEALQARGYSVLFLPDEGEAVRGMALNFVTLGPRHILMAAGNPITQAFYEGAGITCHTVEVDELLKAAGGIGCLTGILERSPALAS